MTSSWKLIKSQIKLRSIIETLLFELWKRVKLLLVEKDMITKERETQ